MKLYAIVLGAILGIGMTACAQDNTSVKNDPVGTNTIKQTEEVKLKLGVTEKAKKIATDMREYSENNTNICRNAIIDWEVKYDESLAYVIANMNPISRFECAKQIEKLNLTSVVRPERYALISKYLPEKCDNNIERVCDEVGREQLSSTDKKEASVLIRNADREIISAAKANDPDEVVIQTLATKDKASAKSVEKALNILKSRKNESFILGMKYEGIRSNICPNRPDVKTCEVLFDEKGLLKTMQFPD